MRRFSVVAVVSSKLAPAIVAVCMASAVMAAGAADSATATGPVGNAVADFVVNSTLDAVDATRGNGLCVTAAGACTLRAAIQEANALTGARVITLPAGTYTLTIAGRGETAAATGDLNIGSGKNITINGASAATTIIDANLIDRAFQSVGGSLTLNDVTVQNGSPATAFGGCFYMSAGTQLTLNRAVVKACNAGTNSGGGIIIFGGSTTSASTLTLTDTTITQNTSTSTGGGVYLSSGVTATMTRTTISGNSASSGAGIVVFGGSTTSPSTLTLTDTTITQNAGASDGGGVDINSGVAATMTRTTISGNSASRGAGISISGGSTTPSTLTLTDTTIAQNASASSGGGVDISFGVAATMNRTTISGNSASSGAGIYLSDFSFSTPPSTLILTNTTISGNTAPSAGAAIYVSGVAGSGATLTNVTIASNSSGGSGAVVLSGAGQYQVRNTIIANSTGAASVNCFPTSGGILTDLGNNLEYPGTTCGFGLTSDRRANPLLAPLADNGGGMQTHALTSTSPAIDTGDDATCATGLLAGVDQRGFRRTAGAHCDMGAFEFGSTASTVALDRTSLVFGAVTSGGAFSAQTSAQTVRLTQTGAGPVAWTATSNKPWLTVTPASGSGSTALSIAVKFDSSVAAAGNATGAITLGLTGAANTVGLIPVTLTVVSSTAAVSPPFGSLDTPAGDATVLAGSIALTGWTLDNIGVKQVELWRDLQPGETTPPGNSTSGDPRNGKIYIANGTFVDGARPDVEGLYPTTPANYRAGWGYLMLTWGLFGQGNGTYKFYAFGVDQEGNTATIGTKTVIISNTTASKPFGSIDTPAIGGEASGPNFGWGLTPKVNGAATCKIQASGVQYSIDSGPLQPVVYGDARTDIAGAFTGFSNTATAGGHAIIDWTALTNGSHTIGWLITDDCNRADGVGSRFFTVTNGVSALTASSDTEVRLTASAEGSVVRKAEAPTSDDFRLKAEAARGDDGQKDDPVLVARGYGELPVIARPGEDGSRDVEIKEGERIELRLPRGFASAYQLGPADQHRALPTGSTWDAGNETFSWQPAPGFLGPFRFVFTNGSDRISVRVIVTP